MKRLGVFFLASYTGAAGVAHAATYYVATNGADANTCTQAQSISTPVRTIGRGLRCMVAGDTLLVRSGTYNEMIDSRDVASGSSWSNKVRIAAYPGEAVWLTPLTDNSAISFLGLFRPVSYVEFDGINLDGRNTGQSAVVLAGYNSGNVHHIRIQNAQIIPPNADGANGILAEAAPGESNPDSLANGNEFIRLTITGGGGGALNGYSIYVKSSNNLIDGCDLSDPRGGAMHIYSDYNSPSNNIIRNNRVHDVTRSKDTRMFGILIAGQNNQVYNNIVYRVIGPSPSTNDAIAVFGGSGHKIWNNTVTGNDTRGIHINSGAGNTEIRNNISYANTFSNFVDEGASTIQSSNLFGVDPIFVNPSANDFRLQSSSRAVDAAVSVSAVATDFAGTARPQGVAPDVGAYEYRAQQTQSSPPAAPTGVRIVSN